MSEPTVEIRRGASDDLIVRFPFDWSIVRRIRRVPGRRWVEREGHWTIPARVSPLLPFLRSLGPTEIGLDPSLEPLLPLHRPPDARWRLLDPARSSPCSRPPGTRNTGRSSCSTRPGSG